MASDQPWMAAGGSGAGYQEQLIRREGEYWTIIFAGVTCRLRDVRGLRHLALLLAHPHEEISALVLERGALDPGDRTRSGDAGPPDIRERARVNVTRAISGVLRRIEMHHPNLAAHLRATIKTGTFCSYTPDPRVPLRWTE